MFANKNLFADDEDIDVDAPGSAHQQNARPMTGSSSSFSSPPVPAGQTFDRQPTGNLASSMSQVGQLDDLPSTPTPAMRKQKMEEMRKAQLDKRKQKAMAAPSVLRANQDQLKSPQSSGGPTASPMSSPVQPRPSSGYQASPSPTSSGIAALQFSPRDSDDENEAQVGIETGSSSVTSDGHISHMLAEKRAEKARANISGAERDMLERGIAPVFDPVKPMAPGVKLDFSDMRTFLLQPVPKGTTFQCYILRNKKGLKNKLYPTYEAYISGEERFLLAARKRTKNKTSNYMISMDKNQADGGKESASYLGKVRSNFVGTEFVGYDRGVNPKDLGFDAGSSSASGDASASGVNLMSVRQELCAVFYESNILGSKGPRKMTAVVPSVRKDGAKTPWKPLRESESILHRYKGQPSSPEFMSLVNKTPKWNDQVGAYVLNFNGRVTQASVKNFQLIHLDDPETVLLQFGRIGKDTFTMDLQFPLSPIQAFQICLTSFDNKFACE